MAFKINADKYAYSATPAKVSENYAAELAKKLVADEERARQAEDAALKSKVEQTAAEQKTLQGRISEEAQARGAADDELRALVSDNKQSINSKADNIVTVTDFDETTAEEIQKTDTVPNILEYLHKWVSRHMYLVEEELVPVLNSLRNKTDNLTESKADKEYMEYCLDNKANKHTIITISEPYVTIQLTYHNFDFRLQTVSDLSFMFEDGEYADDYISGLSFDSGATPTAIDYTDSGILNWVGTDCSMTSNGLSIFQPSPNTHYDIVFYFNGNHFIGLVNGYVSSIEWQGPLPTGNEAV